MARAQGNQPELLRDIGRVYFMTGSPECARLAWMAALGLTRENTEARATMEALVGLCDLAAGDPGSAGERARRGLEHFDGAAWCLLVRAIAAAETGDAVTAEDYRGRWLAGSDESARKIAESLVPAERLRRAGIAGPD